MAAPIKVFICYKKVRSWEEGGKIHEVEDYQAALLHEFLNQDKDRFDAWVDESKLPPGVEWETEIYRQILASDVLLVVVGRGTSDSHWVRREIALATALGITVFPLGVNAAEMTEELKKLEIAHLQGKPTVNLKPNRREALLAEITGDLLDAAARTRQKQGETLKPLLGRKSSPEPKADDNQRAATFELKADEFTLPLHIATGDMTRVRGIDVLVSSENNFMQMARVFEGRTLSSILRWHGMGVRNGRKEDTIQQELDWLLRERGRPVDAAEVFATSAGGPSSTLSRTNKARYILHVASVEASVSELKVIPYKQPYHIEACTRASLAKIAEINDANGIISPPGTEQRAEQERLAAKGQGVVRSAIFPLFGTGQGGCNTAEVLRPMLEGLQGYLTDSDNRAMAETLKDVYLSVYREKDFQEVTSFLEQRLGLMRKAAGSA